MKKEYDVFISYAHEDSDIASMVYGALEKKGLKCFIDKDGISGGDDWLSVLAASIQKSCIFIPLVSRAFYVSDYSMNELQLAVMEQKRGSLTIFPYIIEEGTEAEMPAEMTLLIGSVQWLSRREVPIGPVLAERVRESLRDGFIRKEPLTLPTRPLENHCYYHPSRSVVAYCVDCGKNLCRECADKYQDNDGRSVHICDDCFERRHMRKEKMEQEKRQAAIKKKQDALSAAKEEHEDKVSKFFMKLLASILLGMLIFVGLYSNNATGAAYWSLLLSFFPYGFMIGLAGLDAGSEPTVKFSDGTTNGGCLIGIILGLLLGTFGGVFVFFRDLIDLLNYSSDSNEILSYDESFSEADGDSAESRKFIHSQLVVIKETEDQFRIAAIKTEQGKRLYYSERFRKWYRGDEIEDFDVYWQNKKG